MEWQQAGSGGPDEKTSPLREGIGRLTLEASIVSVFEPIAAGLIEREGQRLADVRR